MNISELERNLTGIMSLRHVVRVTDPQATDSTTASKKEHGPASAVVERQRVSIARAAESLEAMTGIIKDIWHMC